MVASLHRKVSRCLTQEDLEDLSQHAVSVLWEKLPSYQGRSSLATFAYRIVIFELANAHRKAARRGGRMTPLGDSHVQLPDPARESVEATRILDLHLALSGLSEEEENIVRLKHYEGRTFEEIAERLAMSASQVKTRYYRSLEQLRRRLRTSEEPSDG